MNAKQYLESQGLNMKLTTLIAVIENKICKPDLIHLMEEYAKIKIAELDYKVNSKKK